MMRVDVQNVYKVKKEKVLLGEASAHHIGLWHKCSTFLQAFGGSH
jgi:hypothetical protein